MSYEILYNKQFVKVGEDKFLPMILIGSNNCTTISDRGREIRARDWHRDSFNSNGIIFPTGEQILNKIDEYRNSLLDKNETKEEYKYDDEHFGSNTSLAMYGKHKLTFSQYRSFYKTAIKQALTVEQLKEFDIDVEMYVYFYNEEDATKKGLIVKPRVTFTTTEELLKTYAEWEKYYGVESGRISFALSDSEWAWKKLRKSRSKKKELKEKQHINLDSYWVLEMVEGNGYYVKSTARRIRHSYYSSGGKVFIDEKCFIIR